MSEKADKSGRGFGARWSDLGPRLISAAVLLAITIFAVFASGPLFAVVVSVAFSLVYREWDVMIRTAPLTPFSYFLIGLISIVPLAAVAGGPWAGWLVTLFALICALVIEPKHFIWRAIGLVFVSAVIISIVALRGNGSPGFAACFFLGSTVWMTDTGAFFAGRLFGGAKLSPGISPGKTWSGAVGGLILGTLSGVFFWVTMTSSPLWIGIILAATTSVMGQFGDLAESWVKRRFRVKDSGDLIPGHGGLMDRLDSLSFGALFVFMVGYVHAGPHMSPAGFLIW